MAAKMRIKVYGETGKKLFDSEVELTMDDLEAEDLGITITNIARDTMSLTPLSHAKMHEESTPA